MARSGVGRPGRERRGGRGEGAARACWVKSVTPLNHRSLTGLGANGLNSAFLSGASHGLAAVSTPAYALRCAFSNSSCTFQQSVGLTAIFESGSERTRRIIVVFDASW